MRLVHAIPGGIHPAENKSQSLGEAITPAGIPELLALPLSQHIGAPARPVVTVGDRVLKGQVIAEANGFVSVPVHAPTSGEIVAIGNHPLPHPSAMAGPCISLRPDGQDRWIERQPVTDYAALDKPALLDLIRRAGIAGMGGAGFPAAVKLAGKPDAVIETLIINGTECEPYITADDILMRERSADIVAGIQVLQHLVGAQETLLGIEDNKPQAITAMRAACAGTSIEVVVFPTKYPSGGEKQLIQILTGKEVPNGGLPADVGIVMQNVGTALVVGRAVLHGEPLISRITTVTGNAVAQPRNYEVLLGTPVSHLLTLSGFRAEACERLIIGGPMMGFAVTDTRVPVVKTTNCILAPDHAEAPSPPPAQACIRCGLCAQACPVSLLPQQLYWFSRGKELEKLEAHNLADCIECGCCSYVCPSNIPLVQYYRASKAAIRQKKQDQEKAEQSRTRFESRQARITRDEREKEAKKLARQQAAAERAKAGAAAVEAAPADDKAAAIQAAVARAQAKKAAVAAADPAANVIARAQARRVGGEAPARDTTDQRAKMEARLAKARQRLEEARAEGSDAVSALEAAVAKQEAQLAALNAAADTAG